MSLAMATTTTTTTKTTTKTKTTTAGKKRKASSLLENSATLKQPRVSISANSTRTTDQQNYFRPTIISNSTPVATNPRRPPLQDISSSFSSPSNQQSTDDVLPCCHPSDDLENPRAIPKIFLGSGTSSSSDPSAGEDGFNFKGIPYCEGGGSAATSVRDSGLKDASGTRQSDRLHRNHFIQRHGDIGFRLLRRELEGSASMPLGGFHVGDWRTETGSFHSAPTELHRMQNDLRRPTMPFCASSFNDHPIVAIGDESGGVRLLATQATLDGPIFKGSTRFEKPLLGLLCHDNAIFDVSISRDDRLMATASGDQTCRVFDLVRQECTAELTEHMSSVKQVAFNPSNPNLLVTSSRDSNVHFWDLRVSGISSTTGGAKKYKPVNSIESAHLTLRSKSSKSTAVSVTAAVWGTKPEFDVLTACESNAVIKLWDIRLLRPRRHHAPKPSQESQLPPHHDFNPNRNYGITSLNLSPSGDRLYALCKDSTVYAYSMTHLMQGPLHGYANRSLRTTSFYVKSSLSNDGTLLATGSSDGSVILFPTDERYLDDSFYGNSTVSYPWSTNQKSSVLEKELIVGNGTSLAHGHSKEVTGVSWASNGTLVSISDDLTARLWRDDYIDQKAHELREGGENQDSLRWGWGWADD